MADLNDGSSPTVKSSAAESFAENANAPDNSSKLIDRISHPVFIFAYLANLAVVTANAAMFMFADWVAWLATHGGSDIVYVEELPGRIVREGLIAAICARVFLGMSIDRFGVRHVWLCMSLTALCGACVFGSLQELTWLVYVGRVCFAVGLAGMFTCSTFHMQDSVAEHRRTEFIALLGSSGFLGMILGSQLAGFFRRSSGVNKEVYFANVFFAVTSLLLIYILLMWFATSDSVKPPKKTTRPTLLKLTWQYWPGFVLFVAMTMGMMFTVTSLYLVRFNRHAGDGRYRGLLDDLCGGCIFVSHENSVIKPSNRKVSINYRGPGRSRFGNLGIDSGSGMVAPDVFGGNLRAGARTAVSVDRVSWIRDISSSISRQWNKPDARLLRFGRCRFCAFVGSYH